ncbi:TatD family hydrolase [Arenimonas sp.]|uniref:TatD family hydrolase n=1 Tax=Arenimonas sp. TaxID=1872635 RepID=UPI0039E48566
MAVLFDSHCHLDAEEFDGDRADVIARARAAGVTRQLLPAVEFATWPKLRDICRIEPGLSPAYGLHPMYLSRHLPSHLEALPEWIERERPCAVGEFGLDFFVDGLDAETQRLYFLRQLEIAREFDLPVVLHARRAVEEVIASLRRIGGLRGVVHSYSGSEEQARQLFGLGFSIGIGGPLTYDRAQRLHRIVASMPLEFLLLETDSPDQPGSAQRGQRNEPAHLAEVLAKAAQLRGASEESVAEATALNAERLFGRLGA